jgi:hypothetical protein
MSVSSPSLCETPDKHLSPKGTQPEDTVKVIDVEVENTLATPLGIKRDNFTLFGAFGLAFSVINSWVVLVVGLGAGLVAGGPSARECLAVDKVLPLNHQWCGGSPMPVYATSP